MSSPQGEKRHSLKAFEPVGIDPEDKAASTDLGIQNDAGDSLRKEYQISKSDAIEFDPTFETIYIEGFKLHIITAS
jgi:hypothetical protein